MSTILLSRPTVANIYNPQNQTKEQLIDSFVVRQQLFKKLFKVIKEAKMEVPEQHYLILGRRGMGKTTLLLRLAYEIQNDPTLNNWLIPLVFNEEEYGIHRLFKFWERVMELLEEKHPAFRFESETLRQLSRKHTDHDTYEKALFEWLSEELKRNGKKLILFIDNFGEMSRKLSDAEAHRLRKILQTSSDIRVIAASSVVLEAFYKYDHAFYEFFKQVELKGLDEKETRDLLLSLSHHYKKEDVQRVVEQNPGRVEALRRITGGVIRSIVLLFEIFADDGDGSAFHDLQVILDRTSPLYKHRMDDLSDQQQAIVEAIALNWDAISVKEIVEQTRLDSKVVSAQLNGLEKNGIVEKRATRTKNHLYLVAERFFNIWFLMRLGRKADQKRVLWLVRFFEDWCDKDLMKSRSQSHIAALHRGAFDPEGAFYITQAMAGVKDLDMVSKHKMLEETRTYLSAVDRELAESLSQSDLDMALEAIEKWYAGEREEALRFLKSARPFTSSKINELLENTSPTLTFQDMEESILQVWQEAMDDFACDIGWIFNDGLKKTAVAIQCFEHSIQSDCPRAMNSFGMIFENEYKDLQKAEEWYRKSAEKGYLRAMNSLGLLYQNQHQNPEKAEEWWLKSMEKGDADAMCYLGWLYQYEHKDLQKAEEWYLKAVEKDDSDAMRNLGWLFQYEHKDLQKAEEWYLKAVEKGDSNALFYLGLLCDNEYKDIQKTEAWYLKAAEEGNSGAMNNLGWVFEENHKDIQKAEGWYIKAAERGEPVAMNNLARLYQTVHKNLQKAEEWWLKAVEKDNSDAMLNLGWLYKGDYNDLQKAEEWWLKAVEKGNSD
ncbi:MAG: SEL1-like repeat protein, partial [Phycisphaerae bacterium]|nr:SEL1-like repeat protein [Saprospiraceae bacterium]